MSETHTSTSDTDSGKDNLFNSPVSRRKFLRAAGGGLTAVAAGSTLAACGGGGGGGSSSGGGGGGGKNLSIMLWSHFVPAFDKYYDKWAADWGKKNGVNVRVDHVKTQTVFPHFTSEISAGTGHDLVQLQYDTQPAIVAPHLADVSDLHKKLGSDNGGYIKLGQFGNYKGNWVTIPAFFIQYAGVYRKDMFGSVGGPAPSTMDDLTRYGAMLKKKGHPVGIGISAIDDSEDACMGFMFAYGATFVGKDGKTLTFDSPETRDALNHAKKLYTNAMTSQVLSWDDSSNNTLLDSGVGCYILNPISAYRSASKEIQSNTYFTHPPDGSQPGANNPTIQTWVIPKFSKNQDTAKQFISDFFAQYGAAFKASTGYNMPFLKNFLKKPMPILGEGKYKILQDAATWSRGTGWPGPPTAEAGRVASKYVISSVFNKYVAGEKDLEGAVAYGMDQLKSIYK
ncbi:MAG: ABC transporter substrate-binding protein [Streptosporangiaceae bacterium]